MNVSFNNETSTAALSTALPARMGTIDRVDRSYSPSATCFSIASSSGRSVHQRDLSGELEGDQVSEAVLDLVEARDNLGRQHPEELLQVLLLEGVLLAVEGDGPGDQVFRLLVGRAPARWGRV
jgi:hypothetical protein